MKNTLPRLLRPSTGLLTSLNCERKRYLRRDLCDIHPFACADWFCLPPFFHYLRTLNPLRVDVLQKLYSKEPHPTFTRSHMADLNALEAWQSGQVKAAEEQVALSKVR